MKLTFWLTGLCILLHVYGNAQDMEGCVDHPLFSRMPNFYLYDCSDNYAALNLQTGDEDFQSHEGNLNYIEYRFNEGKSPSWLQVTRNHENVILKLGGKKIYSNIEVSSYSLFYNGQETYVQLYRILNDELDVIHYSVSILMKETMRQDITAGEMYTTLCNVGAVALDIHFETGKSNIAPESMSIIDELAGMMKANPALKVSIQGHTDNVGNAASNKTLSQERANAVSAAIISKGIDKSRLSAVGWGQEKPCADNMTEEGRAKNRRVEIVKV